MQKKLIAMAVAGLVAAPAFAQSSVTLYGRVDMGYSAFTNDGKGSMINEESSNRIGFKGEEDLGSGWKAFFQLENRFFLDNGNINGKNGTDTGTLWKDKAWVGLGHKSFGELYLGRVHSAAYTVYGGAFEAFGGDTIGQVANRRGAITSVWSNSVRYISPNFADMVKFIGTIGPSENGGPNRWGVAAQFGYAGFKSDLYYQKDTTEDIANGNVRDCTGFTCTTTAAGSLRPFKTWGATLGYNFGFMEIFGGFAQSKSYGIDQFSFVPDNKAKFQVWQVGTRIPVGNGTIMADYGHTSGKYMNLQKAQFSPLRDPESLDHIGLGYWYNLSKRTVLMANFSYDMQDEGFKGGRSDDSFGYQFAVRHSF